MGSMWTDGQLSAVQAQLARVRRSIEAYDQLRTLEGQSADESRDWWAREIAADEPEADDLWDDAQDAERYARGLGFAGYDEYYAASYEAFAAWVDGQRAYERAE